MSLNEQPPPPLPSPDQVAIAPDVDVAADVDADVDGGAAESVVGAAEAVVVPRWRRWTRRLLKTVLWVATIVVALVVVALLLLQTEWGQGLLKDQVVAALNGSLAGKLSIGRLSGNPPFSVVLEDVELFAPDGTLAMRLDRVDARLDPIGLFSKRVVLPQLHVRGVKIAGVGPAGDLPLALALAPAEPSASEPEALDEEPSGPGWTVAFESIQVEEGKFGDRETGLAIADLEVGMELTLGDRGVEWTNLRIAAATHGVPLDFVELRTTGRLESDAIVLDELEVRADQHHILAVGRVDDLADPRFDLQLRDVYADLEGLGQRLGIAALGGEATVRGTVNGGLSTGVDLALTAKTTGGHVDIEGRGALKHGKPTYDVAIRLANANPSLLWRELELGAGVTGTVTAKGFGNPMGEGQIDAHVRIAEVTGIEGVPVPLDIRAEVESGYLDARVVTEGRGELLGSTDIRVTGELDGVIEAKLALYDVDLSGWDQLFLQQGIQGAVNELRGEAKVDLSGKLPTGTARFAFDVEQLAGLAGVAGERLHGTFDVEWDGRAMPSGVVHVTATDVVVAGQGTLSGAEVDLALEPSKEGVGTDVTGYITAAGIDGGPERRIGTVAVDIAARFPPGIMAALRAGDDPLGPGLQPVGRVRVAVHDAEIEGRKLASFVADQRLEPRGERLHVDGPFHVGRFSDAGGGMSLGSARGQLNIDLDVASGGLSGAVELALNGAKLGGGRSLGTFSTTLEVALPGAAGSQVDVSGSFRAGQIRPDADVGIQALDGELQLAMTASGPVGTLVFAAEQVRQGDRRFGLVKADLTLSQGWSAAGNLKVGAGPLSLDTDVAVDLPLGGRRVLTARLDTLRVKSSQGLDVALRQPFAVRLEPGGRVHMPGSDALLITGKAGKGDISLSAHELDFDPVTGRIRGAIKLSGFDIEPWLRALGVQLEGVGGVLALQAQASGSLASPSLAIGLKLSNAHFGAIRQADVNLGLMLKPGVASIPSALVTWGARQRRERVEIRGLEIPLDISLRPFTGPRLIQTKPLNGYVSVRGVRLKAFTAELGAEGSELRGLSGTLSGEVRLGGTVQSPRLCRLNEPVSPPAIPRTCAAATPDGSRLPGVSFNVRHLNLGPWKDAKLAAEVLVMGDSLDVDIRAESEQGGELLRLYAERDFGLDRLMEARDPIALLSTQLDTLGFTAGVHLPETQVGALPLVGGMLRAASLTMVGADLAVVGPLNRARMNGQLMAGARLGTTLARGQVWLEPVPDAPPPESKLVEGEERVQAEVFTLANASVSTADGGLLNATIHLPPGAPSALMKGNDPKELLREERLRATITTSELDIDDLWAYVPEVGDMVAMVMPGAGATAEVMLRGGAEGPVVSLSALLKNVTPSFKPPVVSKAKLVAQVGLESASFSLDVEQPDQGKRVGGTLRASGEIPLGTKPLLAGKVDSELLAALKVKDGEVVSKDLDLSGLATAMPGTFGVSEGRLNAHLKLVGTLLGPGLRGRAEVDFERVAVAPLGLYREGFGLVLNLEHETRPKGAYLMDVRLGTCAARPTALSEPCRPSDVQPLVLRDKQGGTMTIETKVSIEGRPLVAGQAAPKPIEDLLGRVRMTDGFRLFDSKTMKLGLTGFIDIDDVDGSLAKTRVGGELTISGGEINPEMGGSDVASTGMPDDVVFVTSQDPLGEKATEAANLAAPAGMDMSITVTIPERSIRVRNDMFDLWFGGALTATTNRDKQLALKGIVNVLEGQIELYGRRFEIMEDSKAIFRGDPSRDPLIQIRAAYDISQVDLTSLGMQATGDSKVVVAVSGDAAKPELALSSDPPMDQSNIMSIMVMGSPVGFVGDSEGLESQMSNLFVGLATGQLARLLTSELPIDVFRVETDDESFSQTKLTVGKRLTRDLTLISKLNFGGDSDATGQNENRYELQLEYAITRKWVLQTRFGDAGEGGLDVLYRHRY